MIVEFNGLPGTGKTTVCKKLGEILEGRGYKVMYRIHPPRSRLARYASYVGDGSTKLYRIGRRYADRSSQRAGKGKRRCISVLVMYYRMYRRFAETATEKDVLLIDQGILQSLISVNHGDRITETVDLGRIFDYLKSKDIDFVSVDCSNDVDTAEKRIIGRNASGGRLDVCDEEERLEVLRVQRENFDTVRAAFRDRFGGTQLEIDTAVRAEDNALAIAEELGLFGNSDEKDH